MDREQVARFDSMRQLVDEASAAVESMRDITNTSLQRVDNHSAAQAEQLQILQQRAGTAVQALNQVAEIARHARSYQAQAHHRTQPGDIPQ